MTDWADEIMLVRARLRDTRTSWHTTLWTLDYGRCSSLDPIESLGLGLQVKYLFYRHRHLLLHHVQPVASPSEQQFFFHLNKPPTKMKIA